MTQRLQDDYAPVVGGVDLPDHLARKDADELRTLVVESDLDKHIVRLLALHSELKVRFRNQDLRVLDDATKEALLADMNEVLGIHPLRKTRK